MPILQQKKAILVEARKIKFKGKAGEEVEKWKYTFLTPENKLMIAYDDNGIYEKDVKTVNGWEEKESKLYSFVLREFQGQTKLQLFLGDPVLKVKQK